MIPARGLALDANILIRAALNSKQSHKKRRETMTTKDHLARHDSQIARLEQVMTALAESQAKTEATTRALSRQWQAYLNTLPKN
jgi:hypothetical protein